MARARKSNVDLDLPTEQEAATYDRLVPMLEAAHREMSELSKKKQDGVVNALKIRNINRLLAELQRLLDNDPSRNFVELLDEETLPQNSMSYCCLASGVLRSSNTSDVAPPTTARGVLSRTQAKSDPDVGGPTQTHDRRVSAGWSVGPQQDHRAIRARRLLTRWFGFRGQLDSVS